MVSTQANRQFKMKKFGAQVAGDGIPPHYYYSSREELMTALSIYSLRLRIAEAALAEEKASNKVQSELLSKLLSRASLPSEGIEKTNESHAVVNSHCVAFGANRKWQVLRNKFRQRFVKRRDIQLILRSGLFDETWYLERNVDVYTSGYDSLCHFILFGGVEGRDPSPSFSSRRYLDENNDVATAKLNPLVHYLRYGRSEGRTIFSV